MRNGKRRNPGKVYHTVKVKMKKKKVKMVTKMRMMDFLFLMVTYQKTKDVMTMTQMKRYTLTEFTVLKKLFSSSIRRNLKLGKLH